MHTPKVSLIMSVYNGRKHVRKAIESVLDQTCADFEFIIIDDASTDGTSAVLDAFVAKDQRVKVIKNPVNIGLTKSLNKALEIAGGQYIARMDADDICLPERLEKQLAYMENHRDVGALGTNIKIIDDHDNIIKIPNLPKNNFETYLRRKNVFIHGSLMFRKQVLLDANGYDPKMKLTQDYELLLRLSEKTRLFCLPDCLYLLRRHKTSLSYVKCLTQIYYTTMAKKIFYNWSGFMGWVFFIKSYVYNYVINYKCCIPFILRLLCIIR